MPKLRTITLTERPPVRIDEDQWSVIASAADCDDRAVPVQANRDWSIHVREHKDGRRLVYGAYHSQWQSEKGQRGGYVTDAEGTVGAIHDVAKSISAPDGLAADCIADLPAEAL